VRYGSRYPSLLSAAQQDVKREFMSDALQGVLWALVDY
jgi:hypothetical protein